MDTTLNQIVELSIKLKKVAKETARAIRIARDSHSRHLYLIYVADQYKKFGHLRNDVAKAKGATWFGDFTVIRDLAPAKASSAYYYTEAQEVYTEYVKVRTELKQLVNESPE